MSLKAIDWAWCEECPSSAAKYVLVYLAWRVTIERNFCSPSIAEIGDATQLNEKTIRKVIAMLVSCNIISVQPRTTNGGRVDSNRYILAMQTSPTLGQGNAHAHAAQGAM